MTNLTPTDHYHHVMFRVSSSAISIALCVLVAPESRVWAWLSISHAQLWIFALARSFVIGRISECEETEGLGWGRSSWNRLGGAEMGMEQDEVA